MENYFGDTAPIIKVVSTNVQRAMPRDVIIHNVKLSHKGYEWVSLSRKKKKSLAVLAFLSVPLEPI